MHFKLRNFLVGYSLTLADVYLVACMISPFQLLIDQKTRLASFPNLTRFVTLNLETTHFVKAFGRLHFCSKQITPNFEIVIAKAPKKPDAPKKLEAPAGGKKEESKKGGDIKKADKPK